MRILLIGSGGVGDSFVRIATSRTFFEQLVVADYDGAKAQRVVDAAAARFGADPRILAAQVDASSTESITALAQMHGSTHIVNAVDPRFVMPIFDAATAAGTHYLDMAMSLSVPHPQTPHTTTGIKLGDEQFRHAELWENQGRLALVGMGVEPGLSDVFARYASDELFTEIEELGVRDGANLTVSGYEFAPSFSIWTTIEE
ncbi:MAG: saccharopine dehydrogenase family protein, partial [Angustibacter sp.]